MNLRGLHTWLVVGVALAVSGCDTGKHHDRDATADDAEEDPGDDANGDEPSDGPEIDAGEELDGSDEELDADDAASVEDAADAQRAALCYEDSECGAEEICYQFRDLDCDGRPVVCNSYRPRRSCAGECRPWTTGIRPCNAGCPRGYSCPLAIHGTYGACVKRVGVGESCYPYGAACLEGLLCDFNTFKCVSGSSVPGTPCTTTGSCTGNSWCINGTCQPQSARGAACVSGSCGPLDYCDDPDRYGPMAGTCIEQQGTSCSTISCGQTQYCADPDGPGPLPGRCAPLLANGDPCRAGSDHECSSGFCRFVGGTIDYGCVPRLSDGDTCGPSVDGQCELPLICRTDDHKCHALLTLGTPCSERLPFEPHPCAGGAWCSAASGKCEAPPNAGDACDEESGGACPSGLICAPADPLCDPNSGVCPRMCRERARCEGTVSGPCQPGLVCAFADPACDPDAGACARVCRGRVAAGARCESHAECESDSCYDGKCADQVCIRKE